MTRSRRKKLLLDFAISNTFMTKCATLMLNRTQYVTKIHLLDNNDENALDQAELFLLHFMNY